MAEAHAPAAVRPSAGGRVRASLLERQLAVPRPSAETLAALAGLAAVTLFLYREAVFGGRVIFRRDVSMVWLPQVEAFVRSVAAGSWPLWDPFSGFGRPLLADPRAEVLYPVTWLNFIMAPGLYYTLFVVAHMLFAGLGAFLLARRFGITRAGAFVSAAAWIASGPFFSLTLMWHHLAGAAWIPWMFLAADRALDSGRARDALAAGLALAGQVFAGSPDLTALSLPALGVYVLARRPRWRARAALRPAPRWRTASLALAFGLALGAPQWLPTLDWARRSERTGLSYETATNWSLHPLLLLDVALPLRLERWPLRPEVQAELLQAKEPWLHSVHLGAPLCALALAGLASRRPRRMFLLGLLGAAVLFAFGHHTPFHAAVGAVLPPLRMLRFPVKAMLLAGFAWSLLAGFGFDVMRAAEPGDDRRRARATLLVLAALLLLALLATAAVTAGAESVGARWLVRGDHASFRDALAPTAALLAFEGAACLGLLLLAVRRRRAPLRFTAVLLALLALGPLLARHHDMGWTAPADLWTRQPELRRLVGRAPLTRVYVYDYSILTPTQARTNPGAGTSYTLARMPRGWDPYEALVLGVQLYLNPPTAARWGLFGSYDRDILGFDPPPLARLNEFLRESEATPRHARLLRMGGVQYAAALTPGAWWDDLMPVATLEEVFERPIRVFRVPEPLPRAYVAGGVRVADGPDALAAIADPVFDPAREIVLPAGTPRPAPPQAPGTGRIVAWKPDRVTIQADLSAPAHLVLLDAYDPGWRVRVDGRRAALLRANVAFRAVALSAGRHVVEFTYRPASLAWGLAVAGLALTWATLGALSARRRARRAERIGP